MFQYKENIYCSETIETLWEYDYLNIILKPFFHSNIKIFIYSQNNKNVQDIIHFKNKFKPDILIHLSDEWGVWNWQTVMYEDVKLVFRQYMFSHYPKLHNVYNIPLGFMNNYFKNKLSIRKISERKNIWGFCGDMNKKNYRGETNNIFKMIEKYSHKYILKTEPENMFDVYNDCIFMPNRRGNNSLDCFRIYEACLAGCIPIVQGNYQELVNTFSFNLNKEIIPFIFIEDYNTFDKKMINLIEDKTLLQKMSNTCIEWFDDQIYCIQNKISDIAI
jgi:hypothetical protein